MAGNLSQNIIKDNMSKFWEAFCENRTSYDYAFCNWKNEYIIPPYQIEADRVSYMFMNCTELIDASNIIINVTSENPTLIGYCMNCIKLEHAPSLSFSACAFTKNWTSAFSGCTHLRECEIDFGDSTLSDEEIDPIKTRNNMQNTFYACSNLVDISFLGKGSPKFLDLSNCVNLSTESIQSLLEHLYDVSSATSGDYTIKVASGIVDNNTKAEFNSLGWTIEEIGGDV